MTIYEAGVEACAGVRKCGSRRTTLSGQVFLSSLLRQGLTASAARGRLCSATSSVLHGFQVLRHTRLPASMCVCVHLCVCTLCVAYTHAPTPMPQGYIKPGGWGENNWGGHLMLTSDRHMHMHVHPHMNKNTHPEKRKHTECVAI